MSSTYIHPDIILDIRDGGNSDRIDALAQTVFDAAKEDGKRYAEEMLNRLFASANEHGSVESHFNTETLSSKKHLDFREHIINIYFQSKTINERTDYQQRKADELSYKLNRLRSSFFKFLYKNKIQRLTVQAEEAKTQLVSLKAIRDESFVGITYNYDVAGIKQQYSNFVSSFIGLTSSCKIWDVTMTQRNYETKAAASTSISRNEVRFSLAGIDMIRCSEQSLYVENYNGGDFYFYPNFIIYFKSKDDIAIIDYSELFLQFTESRFLEERKDIPTDTQVVGETWYRVNKDGSSDRRFVDNYKIPIVSYGSLHFKTESGINEVFYISDVKKAKHFAEQFNLFRAMIVKTAVK